MPRSTPDMPRISRARSSPMKMVPPRPPARARSGDAGTLEDLKRSSPRDVSSAMNPTFMPSPRGSKSTITTASPAGRTTPRRSSAMSNRQRMTQLAAIELGNSISQMSTSLIDLEPSQSDSLHDSMEGSFELKLNASFHNEEDDNNNSKKGVDTPPTRVSRRGSSSHHKRLSDERRSQHRREGESGRDRRGRDREDRDRERDRRDPSREASRSRHRRTADKEYAQRTRDSSRGKYGQSSRHRRTIDRDIDASEGSDEKPVSSRNEGSEHRRSSNSKSSSSSRGDRGRSSRDSDDRRNRSSSRSRKSRRGGGGSRSRSKSRGRRSKSTGARGARSRRDRGRGNASSSNWKSPVASSSDEEKEQGDLPLALPTTPSLSLDTGKGYLDESSRGKCFLDESTRSKVSESDILDFLTTPRPTRKLGDRGTSSGETRKDRDRDGRRDRRDRRERGRRGDRSPTRKTDRSPQRGDSVNRRSPTRGDSVNRRSPTRSESASRSPVRTSHSPPRPPSRNSSGNKKFPPPRSRSSDSSNLESFLALPARTKSSSGNRSVASTPSLLAGNSNRRRGSVRGSNSNSSDEGYESSESYEDDQQVNMSNHRSLRDFGERERRRRPPSRNASAEDLGRALGLTGDRTRPESTSKRSAPRRNKSNSKELAAFLAQPSRRRGSHSGNRSVASSPAGVVMGKTRKQKRLDDINGRTENGESRESNNKPPSSRSTITTEETSADELDSDQESVSAHDAAALRHISFRDLEKERKMQHHLNRTDDLLYSVFPKHIAEALRNGKKVEPENHEMVTIFFSDIVGFTDISSSLDPLKISDMLDRLYNSFDTLSHYHDVFKVETIGDAYMAVTNLTKEQPDHCKRIAMFAVDAIRVANQTMIDLDDPSRGNVNIRVGFHSGPVVSNVVGSRNPRYCLFGDTVNTASRMESNSEVNRIHCSDDSAQILQTQHPEVRLASRGSINVKGKGKMNTFWVNEDEQKGGGDKSLSKSVFNFMGMNRKGNAT